MAGQTTVLLPQSNISLCIDITREYFLLRIWWRWLQWGYISGFWLYYRKVWQAHPCVDSCWLLIWLLSSKDPSLCQRVDKTESELTWKTSICFEEFLLIRSETRCYQTKESTYAVLIIQGFSGVYGNYYDPRPHLKPGHVFLERFLVPHFDEKAGHCNKPSTKINPALSLVTKKHVNPPDRRLPHSNIRIYKKQ